MAGNDVLSSLHSSQLIYVKRIEKENAERVVKLKAVKRNNIITGLGLAAAVAGIYFYSIFSVKQDHFLDELEDTS